MVIIEDWPGPGQIQKVGPHNMDCARRSGGTPPGNVDMLHALKYVLRGPVALFVHAHRTYILTNCSLQLVVSD